MEEGYTKLALGHHLDDILETFLMNALQKGELMAMRARLQYEKYPLEIIRPLCYANVKAIIEFAAERNFLGYTCTCNFQDNSARKTARRRLELLTDGSENLKNI